MRAHTEGSIPPGHHGGPAWPPTGSASGGSILSVLPSMVRATESAIRTMGGVGMPFCRSCGLEMADDDQFCKVCGAVANESNEAKGIAVPTVGAVGTTTGGAWLAGQVTGLIGLLMLVVGPFMAWATAGIFSASGMQKTGKEAIVIVGLGVIGIVLATLSLANKKSILSAVPLIAALVSATELPPNSPRRRKNPASVTGLQLPF
jgi:hypothetical protein